MTDLRTAAQQALEALYEETAWFGPTPKGAAAIAALKAALAQQDEPETIDEAMRLPCAMAQAYENGYKAGQVHERERIIQFLQEMQRVVGEAHNHYGVAAVRIREMV